MSNHTIPSAHIFPAASDCEYQVRMFFAVNGSVCVATQQTQLVTSWRTDAFNQGNVQFISPISGTPVHEVCEGENISVIFDDQTNFNCNSTYPAGYPPNAPIVSPNEQVRWQQIIYNTPIGGAKIPNVSVNAVPVTNGAGGNIIANYLDPRVSANENAFGVFRMSSPVVLNDPRRRDALVITAPGGFGAGFPAAGQEFEVTIRYWNFCNPYANDFDLSPVGGNNIDGDNPPVERTALIRVVSAPPLPVVAYTANHCDTDGNGTFTITATRTQAGSTLRWYRDAALTDLEKSSTTSATFNPITEGSPALNKATTSAERVINYYVTEQWSAGLGCLSDVRTITFRITDTNNGGTIDHPNEIGATSVVAICTGDNPPAFTNSASASGGDGTNYNYQWEQSTTSAVAGFSDIGGATGTTYNPPALAQTTWYRRRVSSGYCNDAYSNVFQIRVDVPVVGGAINGNQTICETPGNPGNLSNNTLASGGDGSNYAYQWEESTTAPGVPPFNTIVGATGSSYNPPAGLAVTTYYRRRVTSGVCTAGSNNIAYSNVVTVIVDQDVVPGSIGNAQTICSTDNPAAISSVAPASGGDGSSYGYQWQQSTTSAVAGFGNIGGATAITYDPPALTQTTWYRRVASSGACSSENSNVIEITVNPLPTAPNPTGGGAVCSGNPAPDIVWTGLTGTAPFNITVTLTPGGPMVVNGHNSTTFTITAPSPGVNTTYQITTLEDANGCFAAAGTMGGTASVTIGGAAPALDAPFALSVSTVCDDGGATANPDLSFSLVDADFASQVGFILNYRVDGINKPAKNFNTDANGTPTAPITFADAELNSVGPHTIRIVSIISPATCQSIFNTDLPFTVNPRPPTPTNPVDAVACSTDPTGATLQVDIPAVGNLILWFSNPGLTIPAVGATGGTRQNTFTPTSNATQTYYAVTQSQTAPTLCVSTGSATVQHTQDIPPTAAADFPDFSTCNTTETLTATPADNGGSGLWTIGSAVYYESFPSSDNGLGITGPNPHATTFTHPTNNWSITLPANNIFTAGTDWLTVDNGRISARDVNGNTVVWESAVINLTGPVDIFADIAEIGAQAPTDFIRVFYKINGGGETQFGAIDDDGVDGVFQTVSATGIGVAGNTLQIVMRAQNDGATDEHRLDNIRVSNAGSTLPIIADPSDPASSVSNLQVGANTFTWTISSALGACAPTNDQVTITRHALPVAVDPLPQLCEDTYGSTDATVTPAYLTTLDNTVNGGNPAHTVKYYIAATRLPADEIVANITVSSTDQIYTRVTRTDVTPQCTQDGVVTFTVNPLPDALDQDAVTGGPLGTGNPETVYCEEFPVGSGLANNIDLTILEDDIINGGAPRAVAWFEADMTTPVATPNDIDAVVDGRTFFARVTNTLTTCVNFAQVEITVNPLPLDNPIETPSGSTPASYTVCAGTSILLFQVDPSLNPGSTYDWIIPTGPGEFVKFGGGNPNDFFVLLQFPNPVAGPGLPITVQETSADGCVGNINTMNIIVDNAPPAPVIVGDDNVCANEQNVNYTISSPVGGSTYTWNVPGSLGSIVSGQGTSSIIVNMSSTSGNITVTETNANSCISPPAAPFNVTVNARPVMTSPATAEICSGLTVSGTLTLTANLVGTVFDWVVVGKVGPIGGASVGNSGSGQINQTLTNTSNGVGQIIYDVTPKIDIDPGPGFEYCSGTTQNVVIDVYPQPVGQNHAINICSDVPLVYDIQTDNIDTFGNSLPSEFTYTVVSSDPGNVPAEADRAAFSNAPINHTYTNTTTSNVTITYTISPRFNAPQACPGSNFTLTVTVRPEPVGAIDTKTICSGANVAYDLAANITGMGNGLTVGTTYSWIAAPNGNVGGESTVAQAGSNITDVLTNFTLGNEDVIYTVTPTSSLGCPGDPFTVTVTVQPAPVGSNSTATICSDLPLGINLTTSGTAVAAATYNIATASNGLTQSAGTVSAGAGKLANELADDAWTNTGLNPVDVVYTVTPVSAAGCLGASFTVTVTVNPEPVGANSAVTRCSDIAVGVTLTTNAGSVAAATYNIATNANGLPQSGGTVSAGNGKAANELADDIWENTGLIPVDVIYTVTPVSAAGCEGNPFTVTATIRPEPVGANSTSSFCSDQVLGLNITTSGASVAAATFNIVVNPNGLIQSAGTSSAGNGKLATEIADDAWRNVGLAPVDVIYTITPISAAGCLGNDFTITATINPEPVGSNSSTTVCNNVPVGVTLTTSGTAVAAATYNIAVNPNGLTQSGGTVSAGAGKLANEIADDEWTNTGLAPVDVVYTITPVSAAPESCQGDPFTVTATINPAPVGSNSTATRCSDVAVGINLTTSGASVGASSYNIAVTDNGLFLSAGTASAGTGKGSNEIADDVWRNTGLVPVDVVYTIIPVSAAGCQGAAFTVTVTVNPEPVGIVNAITRCSDDVVGINITTTAGSVAADNYTIAVNANGLTLSGGTASAGAGKAATEIADDIWRNTGLLAVDVVYTITPMSLAGCAGDPFTITVTVDPEPVGSNSNITRCSDAAVAVNLTTSGFSVAATDFDIAVNANGLTQVGGTPSAGAGMAANEIADDVWRNTGPASVNVVYTITPNSGVPCSGDPFTVTVTVDPEPVLSPALNGTVCSDNIVNLTLATNGVSVPASGYNILSRTVHPSLTPVAQVVVPNNGVSATYLRNEIYRNVTNTPRTVTYDVVPVGNINGCLGDVVTITITVDPEPVIATTLDATVCSDDVVNLVLATNGTSIGAADYNIVSRTVAGGLNPITQVVVPNGNVAANYLQNEVYRNTTGGSLTVQYVVEATGTINNCLGDQRTITITVAPEPVISTTLDASVCSDNIVNLVLNTNGTSVAAADYNIVSRTPDPSLIPVTQVAVPANNIAATYLQNEVYRNTTLGPLTVQYVVEATGTINSCVGDQRTITITVNPEPVGSNSAASFCSDQVLGFNLTTSGTAVAAATYNIAVNPNGLAQSAGTASAGNGKAANEIADDVWRNTGLTPVNVVYTVTPVSAAPESCLGDPFTFTATINPEPVGSNSVATVCSDVPVGITLTTSGTAVAAATYNIAVNPNGLVLGGGTASAGAGKLANEIADDEWTNTGLAPVNVVYTITPVSAAPESCQGDPFTITVTVNPEPVGNNSAVTRCSDVAVGLTLTTNAGSVAASSYNITVAPNGLSLSAGTASAGNGKAANEIADDVWRNTGLVPVDVVYTIVPVSAAACQGDAFTVTVTVDPEPVGIANAITRCSDDVVGINITTTAGSVAADNYTIAVNANGLTLSGGTASAGAGKAATEIADDIWRNTGLLAVDVVYTITPISLAGCSGDPFTITVTVNPEPVGSNSNITRCSDAAVAVNLTTSGFSVAATDYDIAVNANGLSQVGGTPSAGAGMAANEIADDIWHNEGPASVDVIYTVTPNSGVPCSGDPFTVTVTVDPEPVLSATLNGTVCSDNIVNLTLATNGVSVPASGYNILSRTVHPSLTPVAQVVVPNNGVSATYLRNEIYRNVTNTPRTVSYDVVPVGNINGCLGDAVTITITVDPEPVIATTLDATVCSDDVVNLVLATNGTSIGAADYNIVSRTVAGGLTPVTQVVVPNGNVAANYLQNEVYRNTTGGSLTVQYVVEATGTINSCLGDQRTITITVAPEPVISPALDASVCSDNIVNLVLNTNGTSVAAANYNIVSRTVDPSLTPVTQVAVPAMGVAAAYLQNEVYRNTTNGSLTIDYVVEATGTINGCAGDQRTITITVDPEPVISPALSASVCSDIPIGLVLNTTGTSVGAANYNIVSRTVAGGLTPVSQVLAPTNNVAANYLQNEVYRNTTSGSLTVQYVVEARGSINNCLGDQVTITMTIDPEPVIATTLNASVCSDATVGLVLNTNGTSVGAANYNIVSRTVAGALNPITQVAVPQAGVAANYLQSEVYRNTTNNSLTVQYVVEATGTINGCLGDQRTITITIDPEPVISPALDASVCSDNVVGLVLNTNGTSVSASNYNIVSRTVDPSLIPVTQAVVPANAVIATYLQNEVYRNTTNGSLTVEYVVEARGNINACLGNQETITITVDPEPVISPALDLTVCSDDPTGLILNTNGTSIAAANYNIVSRIVPGALSPVTQVAVPATGVAANYLQGEIYRNTTSGSLTVQYVVEARGTINSCLGDQRTINVTVDPEPVISAALNATVCSNDIVNLILNTNGTSIGAASYEVVSRTVAGGLNPITQVAVPVVGVGSAYLQNEVYENTTSTSLTVQYVVRALGTINGCAGDNRTITITIDPEPVISPALDASVCSDNIVNLVLNTNGTSISALNYNVVSRTVDPSLVPVTQVAVPASGVLPTYLQNEVYRNTTGASLTVDYVVEAVGAINSCLGSQRTITITIDPEPVVATTLDATVCSDDVVGLVLNTNGTSIAAANYNIVNRIVAGGLTPVTQVAVPSNGVADNYLQNEVYRNTTNGSLTVQYIVNGVGTINGCPGDQQTIVITIAPEPVIATTLDKTVCSDLATNLTLNTNGTSVAALNYEIVSRTVDPGLAPINQVAVPAAGVAPTYLQSEIYQNTGAVPLDVVYVVEATGTINGCLSDQRTITITIAPEPVMDPGLDIAGVCSNLPIGLVLNTNGTSVAAANYNIQTITVPGGLTPGGGNLPVPANGVAANYLSNHSFRNTGAVPLDVIYRVVPVSGAACLGDFIDITVTIDPEPVVDPTLNATVCSDDISGILLNTNGVSVAATNYDITLISQEAGLVGAPTTGPGLAPNAIQNDVFNNTTAGPLKVTYEVTPRSAIGCVGQPVQIILTVRPEPVLNPLLDITRCSDEDFNVALATNGTSVPAASFNITNIVVDPGLNARAGNINPLGTPYNGVGSTFLAGDSFENPTAGDLTVQYTVVPVSLQGCL
ncbi:MAG: PKD-like domain-containing protein, partial [Cyclobacteriaceae bacterium]